MLAFGFSSYLSWDALSLTAYCRYKYTNAYISNMLRDKFKCTSALRVLVAVDTVLY